MNSFTVAELIKEDYLGSGRGSSDLDHAVMRLLSECGDLFGSEEDAVTFLLESGRWDEDDVSFPSLLGKS